MSFNSYIPFLNELADTAGAAIRPHFGQSVKIEAKDDYSPVTQADMDAEAAVRALIEERYPDHGIYGEEHGQTNTDKKYVWVIDPIDGTRAFIAGRKEWGTLIALCENGVPVLGVLDQPITGERWLGAKGKPTFFNNVPVSARPCPTLAQAVLSTTSKHYFTPVEAKKFIAIAEQCAQAIDGGDCYAYGLLAKGERDIVIEAGLKPYDILALAPIIQSAGGIITTWKNEPVTLKDYAQVVACGDKALHAAVLATLA